MKIGFIHYHLKRGGVYQVLLQQLNVLLGEAFSPGKALSPQKDLSQKADVVLCASDPQIPKDWKKESFYNENRKHFRYFGIPELSYLEPSAHLSDHLPRKWSDGKPYLRQPLSQAYSRLKKRLDRILKEVDIVHAHNPHLGKNPLLTYYLYELVLTGRKVLYQFHDFPEEGRPENYGWLRTVIEHWGRRPLVEVCYPPYENAQFATINTRDRDFLIKAGIKKNRVHLLPNAISPVKRGKSNKEGFQKILSQIGGDPSRPVIAYPVRGIRRKNLGELVLLGCLFPQINWLQTLPPNNPGELPNYRQWKQFAKKNKLAVFFGVGEWLDLETILDNSDKVITTSVVEGFGLCFLEGWLKGKEVIGRNIPDITKDVAVKGIVFSKLYSFLKVPAGLVDRDKWLGLKKKVLGEHLRQYGLDKGIEETLLEQSRQKLQKQKWLDFAWLDSNRQRAICQQVLRDASLGEKIIRDNRLRSPVLGKPEHISHNKKLILRQFGPGTYRNKLLNIYSNIKKAGERGLGGLQKENKMVYNYIANHHFDLLRN